MLVCVQVSSRPMLTALQTPQRAAPAETLASATLEAVATSAATTPVLATLATTTTALATRGTTTMAATTLDAAWTELTRLVTAVTVRLACC